MPYYSAIKGETLSAFRTIWMDLEYTREIERQIPYDLTRNQKKETKEMNT